MDQKPIKRYLRHGREKSGVVEALKGFLKDKVRLHYLEQHNRGGSDGEMHTENAELSHYIDSYGAGIQVYILTECSTNGYAVTISVILFKTESTTINEILSYLDEHDFVSSHASFKERIVGYHYFGEYLEAWFEPTKTEPFTEP